MSTPRVAIVLAAGRGTRMQSDLPKVLVPVCGRPMIDYVIDTLTALEFERILVVVGYRHELVEAHLAGRERVEFVLQAEQLGTGHAVMVCRDELADFRGAALVVAGDSPMLQRTSVERLLAEFERSQPACLLGTAEKEDPTGMGRIVRDAQGRFQAIVEQRDATTEQLAIREVNLSCYLFDVPELLTALGQLRAENSQGEYYLTDCPGHLLQAGRQVEALCVLDPVETLSINTLVELEVVEAVLKARS